MIDSDCNIALSTIWYVYICSYQHYNEGGEEAGPCLR